MYKLIYCPLRILDKMYNITKTELNKYNIWQSYILMFILKLLKLISVTDIYEILSYYLYCIAIRKQ